MLIEMAVGIATKWLLGKLADVAKLKGNQRAIKVALDASIDEGFRLFKEKYKVLSEQFFTTELLENHICPEVLKLLTRNEQPDVSAIVSALPDSVVLVSESEYKDEINDFFEIVMDSMKKHAVLQEIISNRQIDGTYQGVKNLQRNEEVNSKKTEQEFHSLALNQQGLSKQITNFGSQFEKGLDAIQKDLSAVLPSAKDDGLNKLLTKQLDRSKEFINSGQVKDAQDLLLSIAEEVFCSDDYNRFRWHTNMGACLLSQGDDDEAAQQYFKAYGFAKDEEKAVANRIRAYLLTNQLTEGLTISRSALIDFPESGIVWAFHIVALHLSKELFDESLLPDGLRNDASILLVLSDIKLREGEFKQSFELAEKAFLQNKLSNDARRTMLASALLLATKDVIKSSFRHFTDEQRNALSEAVASFDNVLDALNRIQSGNAFIEVAQNLLHAFELLGDEEAMKPVLATALSHHPAESVFIYFKIKELKKTDDISGIRKLTDSLLDDLDKTALISLAEISANKGDVEWINVVMNSLGKKELNQYDDGLILGMRVCALWKSGDKEQALGVAQENIKLLEESAPSHAFYIRMLDECGEHVERDRLLNECCKKTSSDSITSLVFANLLYDFGRFSDASEKYSKLIGSPGDDWLTKHYLDSLIKSGKRADALATLEKLPSDVRRQSDFRRLEANLAHELGDFEKLESILETEIASFPYDSGLGVSYACVLNQVSKSELLNEYLASDPKFAPIIEENEIEFAKHQVFAGYESEGLLRMYNLFRMHPNNASIAGQFVVLLLHVKKTENFQNLEEVVLGTVVYCEGNGQKRSVVIEEGYLADAGGWPECTDKNTTLAKSLIGHKRGDVINFYVGVVASSMEITGIDSMFLFAVNKAHEVLAKTTSSYGPVWSLNIAGEDGELNVAPLLQQLKHRREHVERMLAIYQEKKFSLFILAKALGTDVLTLLLEWPLEECRMYVGGGSHEEVEACLHLINLNNRPYVIELTGLVELARVDALIKCVGLFGRPLVTQSLLGQLKQQFHISSTVNPTGNMAEVDGKISLQDIPEQHLKDRRLFIQGLLDFVGKHCEVVPAIGPKTITKNHVGIGDLLGGASQDAIYLALERDAILVTEDGVLRGIAEGLGVQASSCVQPILMVLRDRRLLSQEIYSKIVLDKIKRQHDFTSVAAEDLFSGVKASNDSISSDVELVINSFRQSSLELHSVVVVGSQFLKLIVPYVAPKILLRYYELCLNALLHDREQFSIEIHKALRDHVIAGMAEIKRNKVNAISQVFGDRLIEPVRALPVLKPLVLAVRLALK